MRQDSIGFRVNGFGWAVLVAMLLVLAGTASAEDQVTVKGDTLRGTVVDLTPDGVSFDPIHGSGTLVIPWDDVESLTTEGAMVVMHGDTGESQGRIVGYSDGRILLGDSGESIETTTLFHSYHEDYGASVMERLHSQFRYWTASLDLGASYTDATTDQVTGFLAMRITREQGPTRFPARGGWPLWQSEGQGRRAGYHRGAHLRPGAR